MRYSTDSETFTKRVQLRNKDWVEVPPFVEVLEGAGGGGGKGGGRGGTEARDTFRSNATARAILAYSVGETQGLVNGAKSIYFDGTVLQNDDNSFNFQGVRWEERFGLSSQARVQGFDQTTVVKSISTEVNVADGPVIRTVDSADIDAVRLIITLPSLQLIDNSTGDITGSSVVLNFAVRNPNTGVWIDRGNKKIKGKSSGAFQVQYRLEGPPAPLTPWDWRVTRITADSTVTTLQNTTIVDTAVEIEESQQTYPDVAYVAVEVDTSLFGNKIPKISLRVSGVKVRVPVNYTEIGGVPLYTGTWNGTFKWESTSNPVWHVYNMIINNRYGLEIPESFLDKYSFYTIAQYCDAVNPATGVFVGVDDGDGGLRRRFTMNTQITSDDDALTLLQNMASSFRGLLYYGAGAIVPAQDSPKSISAIITNENVLDGRFLYSSTEAKDRITVANIGFNDKDNFYAPSFTTYPPQNTWSTDPFIARFGKNVYDGAKFGCNNEAEAYSFAKWIVYSSINETETAQFTVGPEHSIIRPGEIVEVYDRRFVKERFGGRIKASTTTTVTLDAPVLLAPGQTYSITVVGADGKTLVTRNITTGAGSQTVVTVSPAFDTAPTVGYTWAVKGSDIQPRLFRVLSNEKKSLLEYEIFAMFYDATKYSAVEGDIELTPQPFARRNLNELLPPTGLDFEQRGLLDETGNLINNLVVSWTASASTYANKYRVRYRRDGEQWQEAGITEFTSMTIMNVMPGTYDVLVYARNIVDFESTPASGSFIISYGGTNDGLYAPILDNVT